MTALPVPADSPYGPDNLPYGVYSTGPTGERRVGVRLGDRVLDLDGLLDDEVFAAPTLNPFLAQGRQRWAEVRARLQQLVAGQVDPRHVHALAEVTLHLPFEVGDYVDFYASEHHATHLGQLFRPGQPPLTPNWKHLPIGYHGRAGTIVPSGTDFPRPQGIRLDPDGVPTFGPSRRLDIEAEVGFVLGSPVPSGRVPLTEADNHIFGLTLTNDWSARDIQSFEYVPLGPNLGKSFCTTISPWITPLAALSEARVAPPERDTPLSDYLDDTNAAPWSFDLQIEILLNGEVVSVAPFAETYWTAAQMLAHMTINGAGLRAGDFFAGGTISGRERFQRGSFLEICWGGSEPMTLKDGSEFTFLRDGDEVCMRATAPGPNGSTIALGECTGRVLPAV